MNIMQAIIDKEQTLSREGFELINGVDLEDYAVMVADIILSDRNYLLAKIQEECAEVIVEASKCLLFGPDHVYNGVSNIQKLRKELVDLTVVLDHLVACFPTDLAVATEEEFYQKSERLVYFGVQAVDYKK